LFRGLEEPVPEKYLLQVLRQILQGLAFANKQDKVHEDLRPENIMFMEDGEVKIADFGISRSSSVKRDLYYFAPEGFRDQVLQASSNVWSVGCIVHEVISGEKLF